jgi:hypothetical protein
VPFPVTPKTLDIAAEKKKKKKKKKLCKLQRSSQIHEQELRGLDVEFEELVPHLKHDQLPLDSEFLRFEL